MKKKLISLTLALALTMSLTFTASAGGSIMKQGGAQNENGDLQRIRQITTTILSDRQALITVEAANIELALRLRSLIAGLKSQENPALTRDALSQLKSLQGDIAQLRADLAATNGQLNGLMSNFKQYRRQKDFNNAAGMLEQISSVQQARIAAKTDINNVLRQMIDILSAAS